MTVLENSLQEVSAELFASCLISNGTRRKPSYEAIITDFLSGLAFKKTLLLIIQHCKKLFSVLYKLGGPFVDAGDSLKQSILETVIEKSLALIYPLIRFTCTCTLYTSIIIII